MKIGVIGTGNMGTILIEAWLETKTLNPSDLIITNRTLSKALALQEKYPGIKVTKHSCRIRKTSRCYIRLCKTFTNS